MVVPTCNQRGACTQIPQSFVQVVRSHSVAMILERYLLPQRQNLGLPFVRRVARVRTEQAVLVHVVTDMYPKIQILDGTGDVVCMEVSIGKVGAGKDGVDHRLDVCIKSGSSLRPSNR